VNSRKMFFGRYDVAAFSSFFTYAAGSMTIPIALVVLSRDLGFSLEQGGMTAGGALHLGRTVPMMISMLLCGFVAGRWGKRSTFGWAVLLMGAGLGLCAMAPRYGVLFFALMIAGFGEGVIEGLATPFVQDLHPQEPGRYINFTHGFWSVGVLVTVLAAGALLSFGVSWRMITGVIALLTLIPGLLLLWPSQTGQRYPDHPEPLHWREVRDHLVKIIRTPQFWLFFAAMFVAGGGEFCLTFWCASYIQLKFASSAWAGGAGTACFAAGMVVGRTGWGYIIKQHQLKQLIVCSALVGALITLLFPVLTDLATFFVLLFLSGIATAPFWPSIQSYCADRMPQADTTMLMILLSCAGIPGCGFFTFLMGCIGNHKAGLGPAFYLVPACYGTLAVLIGMEWYKNRPAGGNPRFGE